MSSQTGLGQPASHCGRIDQVSAHGQTPLTASATRAPSLARATHRAPLSLVTAHLVNTDNWPCALPPSSSVTPCPRTSTSIHSSRVVISTETRRFRRTVSRKSMKMCKTDPLQDQTLHRMHLRLRSHVSLPVRPEVYSRQPYHRRLLRIPVAAATAVLQVIHPSRPTTLVPLRATPSSVAAG